ncbi:GIDE domain-containing protein [Candidatus Uabimicrobium sp. HlEnr_7]|uniref:GIDE domain-containing protein n=1 Tax=Candidatus Uabimicrobium helgolandensis TaxID=3095367 RepID=UPI0035584487
MTKNSMWILFFLCLLVGCNENKIQYSHGELAYSKKIPESEIKEITKILEQDQYFKNYKPIDVKLRQDEYGYQIDFSLSKAAEKVKEKIFWPLVCLNIGGKIKTSIFPKGSVEVTLYIDNFQKVVNWHDSLILKKELSSSKHNLYYEINAQQSVLDKMVIFLENNKSLDFKDNWTFVLFQPSNDYQETVSGHFAAELDKQNISKELCAKSGNQIDASDQVEILEKGKKWEVFGPWSRKYLEKKENKIDIYYKSNFIVVIADRKKLLFSEEKFKEVKFQLHKNIFKNQSCYVQYRSHNFRQINLKGPDNNFGLPKGQHSYLHYYIFSGIALFGALIFVIFRYIAAKKLYNMQSTSSSDIKKIKSTNKKQYVEVNGKTVCDTPLTSDLAKEKCVAYEHQIFQKYKNKAGHNSYKLIHTVAKYTDFFVEDETAKILVKGEGAEIEAIEVKNHFIEPPLGGGTILTFGTLTFDVDNFRHEEGLALGYELKECIIPIGQKVYILGDANPESGDHQIEKPTERSKSFIVSTKTKEELIKKNKRIKKWSTIAVIFFLAIFCALMFYGVWLPSKTTYLHPF